MPKTKIQIGFWEGVFWFKASTRTECKKKSDPIPELTKCIYGQRLFLVLLQS